MIKSKVQKITLVGIVVFPIFVALTWSYHQYTRSTLEDRIDAVAGKNHDLFQISLSLVYDNMLQLASFVANNKEIQQLFLQGKQAVEASDGDFSTTPVRQVRASIIARLQDSWRSIQGRFHARQLHFHLGPGSQSFLRLHRPEKFGDRMDNVRYTIVDTNKEQTSRVGFETGRVYSGLRGVVPMFAETKDHDKPLHVGALEAGTSFKNIIGLLKKHLGADIAVVLREEHIKANMWPKAIEKKFVQREIQCNCFIEATTHDDIGTILNSGEIEVPDSGVKTSLINLDNRMVAVTHFALRDYRGTRNPEQDKVGGIFIWWDVTSQLNALHREQTISSVVGVICFLLTMSGLYILMERREMRTKQEKLMQELSNAFKIITESIDYAAHIQRSILPSEEHFKDVFSDHFIIWEPRDGVGGDIYWSPAWGDGQLLILADCTGHGVPGAFVTLIATGALERAMEVVPPGDAACLLQRMHQHVRLSLGQQDTTGRTDDGLELGICYMGPDQSGMTFVGSRFSLFCVKDDDVREVRGDKSGIGYRSTPFETRFTTREIEISENMSFYMVSDGLTEQVGGQKRRMFGKKRFKSLLQTIQDRPMAEQRGIILKTLADYQGLEIRRDDMSVIGFKV